MPVPGSDLTRLGEDRPRRGHGRALRSVQVWDRLHMCLDEHDIWRDLHLVERGAKLHKALRSRRSPLTGTRGPVNPGSPDEFAPASRASPSAGKHSSLLDLHNSGEHPATPTLPLGPRQAAPQAGHGFGGGGSSVPRRKRSSRSPRAGGKRAASEGSDHSPSPPKRVRFQREQAAAGHAAAAAAQLYTAAQPQAQLPGGYMEPWAPPPPQLPPPQQQQHWVPPTSHDYPWEVPPAMERQQQQHWQAYPNEQLQGLAGALGGLLSSLQQRSAPPAPQPVPQQQVGQEWGAAVGPALQAPSVTGLAAALAELLHGAGAGRAAQPPPLAAPALDLAAALAARARLVGPAGLAPQEVAALLAAQSAQVGGPPLDNCSLQHQQRLALLAAGVGLA